MLGRRSLIAAAAAATVARPAIGGTTKTLSIVPQAALNSIDPIWSTSQISRNLGFMVFETLYGRDAAMTPKPQMLQGDLMEDGGRRWTMRLRDGLLFHDGTPVLARDCVASLRRWMKRDQAGDTLAQRLDAMATPDDRTIVLRLNKPFPHLRTLLSKFIQPALMMPQRLAETDPFKQIPEAIGSGPFRWLADEHVLASHAAFARFDRYHPRDEPADFTAGGHRVLVDRVEWQMIPDAATAANALVTAEVDWIEIPLPDLLPMLRRTEGIKTDTLDKYGQIMFLRPNHQVAPTSNPAILQAMLAAIDQREVVAAVMGGDPQNGISGVGFLATGNPAIDDIGLDRVKTRHSKAEVKAMLDKAGYAGERMVMLHATDHNFFNPLATVVGHMLSDAGMNIDDQAMDWATVQTRRVSREPLDKGGWSMFPSVVAVPDYHDPLLTSFLRGDGKHGWFGWPNDPKLEQIYDAWLGAIDPAQQVKLEQDYERQAFVSLPFIPLGRYLQTSAWRDNLSGILSGPCVVFWNITKT